MSEVDGPTTVKGTVMCGRVLTALKKCLSTAFSNEAERETEGFSCSADRKPRTRTKRELTQYEAGDVYHDKTEKLPGCLYV